MGATTDWDIIRAHPCYDEHQPDCDCDPTNNVQTQALESSPIPSRGAVTRDRVRKIILPMVRAVASNSIFTMEERELYLEKKVDAILALFPVEAGDQ